MGKKGGGKKGKGKKGPVDWGALQHEKYVEQAIEEYEGRLKSESMQRDNIAANKLTREKGFNQQVPAYLRPAAHMPTCSGGQYPLAALNEAYVFA